MLHGADTAGRWLQPTLRLPRNLLPRDQTVLSSVRLVKLAKVDATKETTSPGEYGVAGYPTIFFFMNGNKIDFTGERSKEGIISWVEKKVLPATTEVSTQEELDNLQEQDAVHLVLFSEDESELSDFKAQAAGDDYNSTLRII